MLELNIILWYNYINFDERSRSMCDSQLTSTEQTDEAIEDVSENIIASKEVTDNDSVSDEPKKKFVLNTKNVLIFSPILAVLIAVISIFSWVIIQCNTPVIAELGTSADYSRFEENLLLSTLTDIKSDINKFDNNKVGTHTVKIKFLGFIGLKNKLQFVDTTAPIVKGRDICISNGVGPLPEYFVDNIDEITNTTLEFTNNNFDNQKRGKYTVEIIVKDESGNSTKFNSKLTVIDTDSVLYFDAGIDIKNIKKSVETEFKGITALDFSQKKDSGEYLINGILNDTFHVLKIRIEDTIAPTATVKSHDILLGTTLKDSDIIFDIDDFSDVKIDFQNRPNFNQAGEYNCDIKLTDSYGNVGTFTSTIRVHDINTEVDYELGYGLTYLSNQVFKDEFSKATLKISKTPKDLGKENIELTGKFNSITISVNTKDTTAPKLITKNVTKIINSEIAAKDFVTVCTDALPVTYALHGNYNQSTEGTYNLSVIATDSEGNTTEAEVVLTLYQDKTPPVISGIKNFTYIIGEKTPDYLKGITAKDDTDGETKVMVNTSSVNLTVENTYTITYSSADSSGNTATQTASITVKQPTRVMLNVSNINQLPALPNGCEVVSLAIALRYTGYNVDPLELYNNYMPKAPLKQGDPWKSYIGDATGRGYGCYAPCVVATGNSYLQQQSSTKKVYDASGKEMSSYEEYVNNGTPVIFWGLIQMNCDGKIVWGGYVNGKYVSWHTYSHCLVLIGYTDYNYIFCDPLRGIVEYSK